MGITHVIRMGRHRGLPLQPEGERQRLGGCVEAIRMGDPGVAPTFRIAGAWGFPRFIQVAQRGGLPRSVLVTAVWGEGHRGDRA